MPICRLCLKQDENALNIFSSTTPVAIPMRIITCTSLELRPNDGLPETVCIECRLHIEEFYYFRKRCHAADQRLRTHRRLLNEGKESDLGMSIELDEYDDADIGDENKSKNMSEISLSNGIPEWRLNALQSIRSELEFLKKHHTNVNKQEIRANIERELRVEIEEHIVRDYMKQVHIKLIDDLFLEVEEYFIRKRDQTVQQYDNNTEPLILLANSTANSNDANTTEYTLEDETMNETIDLVEIPDDVNQNVKEEPNVTNTPTKPQASGKPPPMVEINYQCQQSNDHCEDLIDSYISRLSNAKNVPKTSKVRIKVKNHVDKKQNNKIKTAPVFCKKHSYITQQLNRKNIKKYTQLTQKGCMRCKLRGS